MHNTPFIIEKQKERMIIALEANYGNVRKAAKLAGITSQTHYRWQKEDEEYENRTDSIKDICYRDIKENLIDKGLKMVEKGNAHVLAKMMGIFLKDLPEEMRLLKRINNVPMQMKIKYVHKPPSADQEIRSMPEQAPGKSE